MQWMRNVNEMYVKIRVTLIMMKLRMMILMTTWKIWLMIMDHIASTTVCKIHASYILFAGSALTYHGCITIHCHTCHFICSSSWFFLIARKNSAQEHSTWVFLATNSHMKLAWAWYDLGLGPHTNCLQMNERKGKKGLVTARLILILMLRTKYRWWYK